MKKLIPIAFLAALMFSTNVFADAEQHFNSGQSYYSQGKYEKAINEFEEAYSLDPQPLLLFNLAQTYERMGNLVDAVKNLKKYVKKAKDIDDLKIHKSKIAMLEKKIASTGVTVNCNEDGADIIVDGEKVAITPNESVIHLSVGAHKIKITKPGFEDFSINVAVASAQSVPVEVNLEAGGDGETVALVAPPKEGEDTHPKEAKKGKSKALKIIPWIVAGVGAATAAVGWAGIGIVAKNDNDTDKAKIADILGFTGAGIFVGGAVWGILSIVMDKKEDTSKTAMFLPCIDSKNAGATFSVKF